MEDDSDEEIVPCALEGVYNESVDATKDTEEPFDLPALPEEILGVEPRYVTPAQSSDPITKESA